MHYQSNTQNQHKRWHLYILKLEKEKWYVGITSKTPEARFNEHKLGKRAAYWTMKYKPVSIELIEDLGVVSKKHAETYENKTTRLLMKERGLNNVRGGDLSSDEDYVRRFGYLWDKYDWQVLTFVILSLIVNIYLLVDKYFIQ